VFVGPRVLNSETNAIVDDMARLRNVHLLGQKTVKDLAAYPQHFDACVMPYLVDGYTNNIYPLKLHEYLASGKPVVGSPIRSLKDFDKVIALATTRAEWSEALTAALAPGAMSADTVTARQEVARQYDWSELTFDIARTICDRLGPVFAAKVKKLAVDTPSLEP
jgi:glycosyltransferase involved in cell wall biosynthesis